MDWVQVASAIVLLGAALAVLFRAARWVYVFVQKITQFLDDWFGEEARPGVAPKRPGVMERLSRVEANMSTVAHEVVPNGGQSIKDQITRIEEHNVPPEARPNTSA